LILDFWLYFWLFCLGFWVDVNFVFKIKKTGYKSCLQKIKERLEDNENGR